MPKEVQECIFKISWDHREKNPVGHEFPPKREVTVGTTLAILWPEGDEDVPTVRALLRSDEGDEHRQDRDAMLSRLREEDRIKVNEEALGFDGKPLRSSVLARATGDLLRVTGTGCMLHLDGLGDSGEQ